MRTLPLLDDRVILFAVEDEQPAAALKWLQAIAMVDPFTYAIHSLQQVLLKSAGFVAIYRDLAFLSLFGIGTLLIATPLFKRTL